MMGRGQNEGHRKKTEEQKKEDKELGVPRIGMDYFYLGEEDKEAKEDTEDLTDDTDDVTEDFTEGFTEGITEVFTDDADDVTILAA